VVRPGPAPASSGLLERMLAAAVSTVGFPAIAREVLDLLVPAVGAESGLLVLPRAGDPDECFLSSWGSASAPLWSHHLAASVQETGLPAVAADLRTDARVTDGAELVARGWRAYLCHPVISSGGVLGTLHLLGRRPECFNTDALRGAAGASHVLALAAELHRSTDLGREPGSEGHDDEAELLMHLSRSLGNLTEKSEVSVVLLDALPRMADLDLAVILLEEEHLPWDQALREYRPTSEDLCSEACMDCLAGLAQAGGPSVREVRVREIRRGSGVLRGAVAPSLRSRLHQPVERRGRLVGMVSLFAHRQHAFGEPQRRMLTTVAAQLSMTLERLQSVAEAERIHLESVVDAMNAGLLWVDGAWRVRIANPAARRLLEELSGGPQPARLKRLGEVDLEAVERELNGGASSRHQGEFELAPGPRRISFTASTVRGRGGAADGMVVLLADVTEERLLQQKLLQSEKLSALGEMISGVAHELNNPLAAVMGYAQLLDSDLLAAEKQKEKLRTIHQEAFRCQRIVQNLLSFARNQHPERGPTDLNGAVKAVIRLLEYSLRVDDVEIHLDLSADLPAVMGDAHELQQVVLNLVSNAQHALQQVSRPRRLQITTACRDDRVLVLVEDNGIGIPPESVGKVFDPFFSTKSVGKGTGLGLSLAYGCVTEHGGEIRVESPPGQGTRFTMELPATTRPAGESTSESSSPVRFRKSIRSCRILVVDDEPSVAEVIAEVLGATGHTVQVAHDGGEARECLKKECFDLIITDLMMPGVSGHELYEEVRQHSPALASRMIFSTGDTVSEATREFLQRTGNLYLTKPFQIVDLQDLVEQALEQAS
jgi:two-component system NtrC family sensor kinase